MISIFQTITACRICSSSNLQEILNFGSQPPANSLYKHEVEEPPTTVPLRLVYCGDCSTAQIGESVDPDYLFRNYIWVTGTSRTTHDYCQKFSEDALRHCEIKNPRVVEIASNDGTFLRQFQKQGYRVLGIDPAINLAKIASDTGVPTLAKFFTADLAQQLLGTEGQADILIARNVIPHTKEIHSVIEGIATLLGENGTGIIEFHDSQLIQEQLQYDYIYHEHLFYFSLCSMSNLLGRHGLSIYDIGRSPISGGSWVVYFSKEFKEKTARLRNAEMKEKSYGLNSLKNWLAFSQKVKSHRESLRKIIRSSETKIFAYGASARSSTLLNYCGVDQRYIAAIIDRNPLKHGLISPGSGIPVISYEEGSEEVKTQNNILLLAWNFREEIIEDLRESGYRGQFIIPLPGNPRIE